MTDTPLTLIKSRLVLPDRIINNGHLYGRAGRIVAIAETPQPDLYPDECIDRSHCYLLPGLIDLQVNGGAHILFNDVDNLDDLRRAIADHQAHGTTGFLATLVCDEAAQLTRQLEFLSNAIHKHPDIAARIIGIHLEGPFFNPDWRGMHPLAMIIPPDVALMKSWVKAAAGTLKIVTLAPDMPGALDVIDYLCDAGIAVSLGHSGATYDQATAAIDRGATLATHLFNRMSQLEGRAPNMIGALLDHPQTQIALINDGYHVHDASLRIVLRAKGLDHCFFVSDAMYSVTPGDKTKLYRGELLTTKDGGVYNDQGKLAGSAAPLLTALQRGVTHLGLSLSEASYLSSTRPAEVIGLSDRGTLKVGNKCDFILLDQDLELKETLQLQ